MPSPKDAEKFLSSEAGVSRDEAIEALRSSLADFNVRLPLPGVKDPQPITPPVVQEGGAGFQLATGRSPAQGADSGPAPIAGNPEIAFEIDVSGVVTDVYLNGRFA